MGGIHVCVHLVGAEGELEGASLRVGRGTTMLMHTSVIEAHHKTVGAEAWPRLWHVDGCKASTPDFLVARRWLRW